MPASHKLAALWQPSHLFAISTLAQSVASYAAAVTVARDDLEGFRAASRFARMSEQLQAKLTPFTDHDFDRPISWPPSADGKLLVALLDLHSCLSHLLPNREKFRGRGRKTLMVFDPQQVYAKLKELRPGVDRLQELTKKMHQLIGERLTCPIEVKSSRVATMREQQQRAGQRLTIDLESKAATLDGKEYCSLDPDAVRILQAIHRVCRTITGPELQEVPGCKGKRIDRCLDKLPAPLRQIVRSATGKGYWIELPPEPSL